MRSPARIADIWWRRRVRYPAPQYRFVSTDRYALRASFRGVLAGLVLSLVYLLVVIVAAFAGWELPSGVLAAATIGVGWAALGMPSSVASGQAKGAWHGFRRPGWTQMWLDLGVPLSQVWMMRRTPLSMTEHRSYFEALCGPQALVAGRIPDGASDVRLTWWLAEVGIPPEEVAAYRALGLSPHAVAEVAGRGLSVQECRVLDGTARSWPNWASDRDLPVVLGLWEWLVPLHDEAPGVPAVEVLGEWLQCAEASIAAWASIGRCHHPPPSAGSGWRRGRRDLSQRCPACGTVGVVYAIPEHVTMGGASMADWQQQVGSLSPWYLAADIGFAEAVASATSPTPPDRETLVALRALRT